MFLIDCPYCGRRDLSEFSCHGEAHIVRPLDSAGMSDVEWGDYVFFRTNPRGFHRERWMHAAGCRRWFYIARDTVNDEIIAIYKVGDRAGDDSGIGKGKAGKGKNHGRG